MQPWSWSEPAPIASRLLWPWPARGGWSDCWRRPESGEIAVENADKFAVQFAQKKENKFALGIIVEKKYSK